ncbi:poly(R)-hydroxyalkanoic acid synthase subunit PhaE [Anaerosphaera multitolerans]|uniref:Poly(3-hydroxyalkanoate) polymerase subunit PhaE n=1 Tax=Anaerosphaera multitolerans TaxID=2487351 RepID=A0A437S4Q9_9FIRM|nr:poly(R)-hydroxyalkanoic acid synthase subunit PhaE [Anaerosphaera multitolerans]RVU53999.1 hypothetical protein EF514_09795 [Anaerosphaera multitolerans]
MDYSKEFLDAQKNMFDFFQKMYTPLWSKEDNENPYTKSMEQFFNIQKQFLEGFGENLNPFAMYQKMLENPGFNVDNFKNFLDMQKQFFDMQKQFFDNFQQSNEFFKQFSENSLMPFDFKSMNEAFDKYKEFYSSYDITKFFDPNISELMDKMSNANKFYLYMYDVWKNLSDEFGDSVEENVEKFQNFVNENSDLTYNMIVSTLPTEFKPFLTKPRELIENYFNTMVRFYEPWKNEFTNLRDLLVEATVNNDTEKLAEFFKLWKQQFDATFGKIINSPALGMSRNIIEQQNKAFDSFINLLVISSELSASISTVQNNAFKDMMKEYAEITKEGMEAKSFEDFFNYWSDKTETYLVDYFGSKEFSKLVGQVAEDMMDFKMETNKLVENYLADTPLVTKNNLDSISKNIYNMKKEIKSLKKEIEELKSKEEEAEVKEKKK